MNWDNLSKGLCPKCGGGQEGKGMFVICIDCEFKITKRKYFDLIKGKNSKAYKKAIKKYKKINQKKKEIKEHREYAKVLQDKERAFNLMKMRR